MEGLAGTSTQMSSSPVSDGQGQPSCHSDLGPSPHSNLGSSSSYTSVHQSDLGPSSSNTSVTVSHLDEFCVKAKQPGMRLAVSIALRSSHDRDCAVVARSNNYGLLMRYSVRDVVALEEPVLFPNSPTHVRYAWRQTSGVYCPTSCRK